MSYLNRLANAQNPYQGNMKKVLCVCSAGLLRSPTIAYILSLYPFGFNTRACGISTEYALIPLDDVLLTWADEIVCVERQHAEQIKEMLNSLEKVKPVHLVPTPDIYETRTPKLVEYLTPKLQEIFIENSGNT